MFGFGSRASPSRPSAWFKFNGLLGLHPGRMAARIDKPPLAPARIEPAEPPRQRVLVVDDDPVNLMVAEHMLRLLGARPMLAADGAEAVALAGESTLDLILMDLQMPVLDGLQATRQIRQQESLHGRPRVPVVAFTSVAPHGAWLRDFGIDGVLNKPCAMSALSDCLARWREPALNTTAPDW